MFVIYSKALRKYLQAIMVNSEYGLTSALLRDAKRWERLLVVPIRHDLTGTRANFAEIITVGR